MASTRDMSVLPADWAAALAALNYEPRDSEALVQLLYANSGAHPVYPDRKLAFRAFHETALDNVRAVVLGQDPYPQAGKANGLAFSIDSAPTEGDSLD